MPCNPRYRILFEPVSVGPVTAPNRFYQVPHCSGMGYALPQTLAAMREIKAAGGWGVVSTEYCSISPDSDDTPYPSASLWDDKDIKMQALMVEKVHKHGALAAVELWHGGRTSPNHMSRIAPLAPHSLPNTIGEPVQSRAMDKRDIAYLRKQYKQAALRAKAADFDIVYIYAAHGYLLSEFLSPLRNQRNDEYGGSVENRVRLVKELLTDAKDAVGDRCAVALRISVADVDDSSGGTGPGGFGASTKRSAEDHRTMVELLSEIPDLWDVTVGDYSMEMGSSRFVSEAALAEHVGFVKAMVKGAVVTVGRFTSPETMVQMVKSGTVDFIGAARPSIADPFLPEKIANGEEDDIRECIGCNICYAWNTRGAPIRCTQNPTMGEEWRRGWHPERIAPLPKDTSVLVIGAGAAGLEATRALGKRGCTVTLAEKHSELGGRVLLESKLPGLAEWIRVRDYRVQQIRQMANVSVYLHSEMMAETALAFSPHHVLVATGATWRHDGIGCSHAQAVEGFAKDRVHTPDDIMAGAAPESPVVIYDDNGYYMGPVIAEKLARDGIAVTLVTPRAAVSWWSYNTEEQHRTAAHLLNLGVCVIGSHTVSALRDGSAELYCVYTKKTRNIDAASLVTITARVPSDKLFYSLMKSRAMLDEQGVRSVQRIGDCLAPGLIAHAVYSGHLAAREIDEAVAPPKREQVEV